MSNSILIVEDEIKLANLLMDYFKLTEYEPYHIDHGDEVIAWVKEQQPKAILLDIMLPGKDGLALCREIRQFSNAAILMVTAKVDEIDRLLGLELGADDYICKPFSPREVVARVKAVLRRAQRAEQINSSLVLDEQRLLASYCGAEVSLTSIEFQLLKPLIAKPGRIFTREQLMDNMYSDHRIVSHRTIDSHIKKLRRKLAALSEDEDFIQSVYGAGYRLILP